jgi:hypothetical protein
VRAKTMQRVQESWKPLKVPKKVKLKRVSAFMHKDIAVRSAEVTELLEEFIVFKAQSGEMTFVYAQARLKAKSS